MDIYVNEEELKNVSGGQAAPYYYYTVVAGDCISKIAEYFGCTCQDIYDLNGIDENTIIYAGNRLIVLNVNGIE